MVVRLRFQDALRDHPIDESGVYPPQYLVAVGDNQECSWILLESTSSYQDLYNVVRQALNPWERPKESKTPYYSVKQVLQDTCPVTQSHRFVIQEERQEGEPQWTPVDTYVIIVVMNQSMRRVGWNDMSMGDRKHRDRIELMMKMMRFQSLRDMEHTLDRAMRKIPIDTLKFVYGVNSTRISVALSSASGMAEYIRSYKPDVGDLLQLPESEDEYVKHVLYSDFGIFIPTVVQPDRKNLFWHLLTRKLDPLMVKDLKTFSFFHTSLPSPVSMTLSPPRRWPARPVELNRLFVELPNHLPNASCKSLANAEIVVEKRSDSSAWFLRQLSIMLKQWMRNCVVQKQRFLVIPVYVMETEISLLRDILVFWRTILELGDNTFLHGDMQWEDAVGYAAWYDSDDRAINFLGKTMELVDALTVRTRLIVTREVIVEYNTPKKLIQYIRSNHMYMHH